MYDGARSKTFEKSDFFSDGQLARPLPEGTVARGQLAEDAVATGREGGRLLAEGPLPVTPGLLRRGQERFEIYCSPCHGRLGDGDGMIVRRGFQRPPSYHADRLRAAPDGYLFDVITEGYGAMPSYAARVAPEDRWAIIAYVRALQVSQAVPLGLLRPPERARVASGAAR
ncbi:MAG: cytochrome c [Acidobacteria bacterium]|nr:cytochrome c [Acidobacteriota bacterium]